MSTRSTQHRIQTQNKIPQNKPEPFKAPSIKSEAKSQPNEPNSFMRDDEEDEILASPQASQGKNVASFISSSFLFDFRLTTFW